MAPSPSIARSKGLQRRPSPSADRPEVITRRDSGVRTLHAQQTTRGHGLHSPFDAHHLGLAQHRGMLHQPCGRLAQHHTAGRGNRFHPLRQSNVLTDCGVTRGTRTDFTGDDLSRIQADPQTEGRSVSTLDLGRQLRGLVLNAQRGEAGANRMILQGDWRSEHRHDPITGELVDRPAVALHDRRRSADQVRHDLAQPLRTHRRRDVHRVHHVGEQHSRLLVLGRPRFAGNRRAARVTEPCILQWLGAARPAHGGCRHGVRIG